MIEIIIFTREKYKIETADGTQLPRSSEPLAPGHYYIVTENNAEVKCNNEPVIVRTISLSSGSRVRDFAQQVRERDGGCVITQEAVEGSDYVGFQAAHIFPLAHEDFWNRNNFSQWVSLPPASGGTINSVQNGLLMASDMHQLFDSYAFSINPDDDYKIIWFRKRGRYGHPDGKLPRSTLHHPGRPVDQLLRWHFRQAVLANMRGAGEPVFEHDFPPGSDMLDDIRSGPKAAERMEAELFGRLALDMEPGSRDDGADANDAHAHAHAHKSNPS